MRTWDITIFCKEERDGSVCIAFFADGYLFDGNLQVLL
jgi:hypothetical protein